MQLYPWKGPFRARVQPPGDKSITHRAVLLSAMTAGDTEIFDPLDSLDTRASVNLVQSLGVELRESTTNRWVLRSPGYDNLKEPDDVVSCANSGTTMRLATGLLAGLDGLVILTGDDSLRERPMARVIDPLRALGVSV
ncbi:MAG: 3-phosphoshikimate 1-carboxyvinyltransferase, partial [Sulfobacillus sp.]